MQDVRLWQLSNLQHRERTAVLSNCDEYSASDATETETFARPNLCTTVIT